MCVCAGSWVMHVCTCGCVCAKRHAHRCLCVRACVHVLAQSIYVWPAGACMHVPSRSQERCLSCPSFWSRERWSAEVSSSSTLQRERWPWRALSRSQICRYLGVLGQITYLSQPHVCYLDHEDESTVYFHLQKIHVKCNTTQST